MLVETNHTLLAKTKKSLLGWERAREKKGDRRLNTCIHATKPCRDLSTTLVCASFTLVCDSPSLLTHTHSLSFFSLNSDANRLAQAQHQASRQFAATSLASLAWLPTRVLVSLLFVHAVKAKGYSTQLLHPPRRCKLCCCSDTCRLTSGLTCCLAVMDGRWHQTVCALSLKPLLAVSLMVHSPLILAWPPPPRERKKKKNCSSLLSICAKFPELMLVPSQCLKGGYG